MNKNKDMVRTAIYIDRNILKRCDECVPLANVRSRNEFIAEAIRYYIGANFSHETENYTLQSVSKVIRSTVNDLENRLARMDFKLACSINKLAHIVAYTSESIDPETMRRLHAMSVDEVKRINGAISYEDAVKFQRGENTEAEE